MSERHDNNVYNTTVKLAPFVASCAVLVLTCAKVFLNLFQDTSYAQLFLFDGVCLVYIAVAIWFKKKSDKAGGRPGSKLITAMRYVLCALILLQWNLITYIFPARDFWGYAPLFVILMAYFLDQKFVIMESIGIFCIHCHILAYSSGETSSGQG